MAAVTGNTASASVSSTGTKGGQNGLAERPLSSLQQRMQFHGKIHEGTKCDLESPASIVANVNIKQLLTPAAFDSLPTQYQQELIKLLPEADRLCLNDNHDPLAMTVTALSNEFFAKSCVEYRDRLRNGEFTISATKPDVEPVIWECDSSTLGVKLTDTGVPKAGNPFLCTTKAAPPPEKRIKKIKEKLQEKWKKRALTEARTAKASSTRQSALKSSAKSSTKGLVGSGRQESKTVQLDKLPDVASASAPPKAMSGTSLLKPAVTSTLNQVARAKQGDTKSPTVITKLKKVTENSPAGLKVTKVIPVPIVVRSPHGQVVTTLANCNPLLSEMIKNKNTQTPTAAPVKVERKRSLLPTILKRNSPVIITLRTSKNGQTTPNGETVNRAVSEVIAKIQSSQAQPVNGSSHKAVVVTYNGTGSNGSTPTSRQVLTSAVNLDRSKQICEEPAKPSEPTLNLERSYQICKQVLGSSGSSFVSVVVGPGGKKTAILSKPVRNRLQLQNSPATASSASHGQLSQLTSDIDSYKSKHRGKPLMTNSGHVFLAMKDDVDGYILKAYKRKAAFKVKPKKKSSKLASANKKSSSTPPHPSSTSPKYEQSSGNTTPTTASSAHATSTYTATRDVTMVTDSPLAGQPLVSATTADNVTGVAAAAGTNNPAQTVAQSLLGSNSCAQLLSNCMCNLRALVICQKCGSFNHAECMAKEVCISCLDAEK